MPRRRARRIGRNRIFRSFAPIGVFDFGSCQRRVYFQDDGRIPAQVRRYPAGLRPRCRVVQGSCRDRFALGGCPPMPRGLARYSVTYPSNRDFAGAPVAEHFARAGPVLVHFAPAAFVPVHFSGVGPLLGHYARTAHVRGHFFRAGPPLGHLRPVLGHLGPGVGHLVRAARAGPVHLRLPPKPGIA
jgi:hypothetical protein